MTRARLLSPGATLLALFAFVVVPPTLAAAKPKPKPPSKAQRAATALAAAGVLVPGDLGSGWSQAHRAPKVGAPLLCSPDRAVLATTPSATYARRGAIAFASGVSYAFSSAGSQRRAWERTGSRTIRACLEHQLAVGSGRGVTLSARKVRSLPAPPLPGELRGASARRYRVTGIATHQGAETDVTLDVVLIGDGTWIAEDEYTSAMLTLPAALEAHAASRQAQRVRRLLTASPAPR